MKLYINETPHISGYSSSYSDYILKSSYYKFSAFNAYIYGTDIINQRNL
jgi:hypothetical protein